MRKSRTAGGAYTARCNVFPLLRKQHSSNFTHRLPSSISVENLNTPKPALGAPPCVPRAGIKYLILHIIPANSESDYINLVKRQAKHLAQFLVKRQAKHLAKFLVMRQAKHPAKFLVEKQISNRPSLVKFPAKHKSKFQVEEYTHLVRTVFVV